MNKISAIIEEICKKEGINYKSMFLEKNNDDTIFKISNIYLTLKKIIGDLSEIEENNREINGIVDIFESAIKDLERIDHEIIAQGILIAQTKKKLLKEDEKR